MKPGIESIKAMTNARYALVTIATGPQHQALAAVTHPLMRDYAARCGMDFLPIFERSTKGDAHFEKLYAYHVLDEYERVLILDSDIVITPNAPDILEVVPPDSFGAYLVSAHTDLHDNAIALVQKTLKDIGWKHTYFNSGVMVVSREHRPLFNPEHPDLDAWLAICAQRPEHETYLDQTYLNYRVQAAHVPLVDITYRYNHSLGPKRSGERFSSYFIHCKGHRKGPKMTEIERAMYVLERPWLKAMFVRFPRLTLAYDALV